jgi:hypothetical protein
MLSVSLTASWPGPDPHDNTLIHEQQNKEYYIIVDAQ